MITWCWIKCNATICSWIFPSCEDGNGVLDFEETVILMHVYRSLGSGIEEVDKLLKSFKPSNLMNLIIVRFSCFIFDDH